MNEWRKEGRNEWTDKVAGWKAGRLDSRQNQTIFLCYRASKPAMRVTDCMSVVSIVVYHLRFYIPCDLRDDPHFK